MADNQSLQVARGSIVDVEKPAIDGGGTRKMWLGPLGDIISKELGTLDKGFDDWVGSDSMRRVEVSLIIWWHPIRDA
jgi:hypothetical protein